MKIKRYKQFLESKISIEMELPKDVTDISNAFIKAGKDIFLVGGAIRDYIQGISPKDYDLVTNAMPEESKKILRGFNVSDEQGKNFGVLRIFTKDEPAGYELASYRKDISKGRDTKGDDQKVEMGSHVTIKDDCMRRDLTINALFYDIKNKEIVDLVGGIDDIKNGIIRAVGDPSERFKEDRLRMCRTFRFAARTGGKISKETADAIIKDNRLRGIGPKDDVSQERIFEEFQKAWKQAKDYTTYLDFYTEFGMWDQVFPGSNINTEMVNSKDFVVVIANLFKNESIGKLERRLVQEYRIPNSPESGKLVSKVLFLIGLLSFDINNIMEVYKKRIQSSISDTTILEWIRVENINDLNVIKFIKFKPSISAQELMNQGFSGKSLGSEINRLEVEKFKKIK